MPKVRALCSAGITQPRRSYDPVRLPFWPLPSATLRPLPSPMNGSPPITRTTFPTCRAHYPGGSSGCTCRLLPTLIRAFPKWQEGRHPHCHFRGLRRLHSRYGPPDRSATQGDLCHEAPTQSVTRPSRSPASGFNRQLSGWNPPPLIIRAFGAHVESRIGAVAWGLWPTLRFPSPLIKPNVPISGIRLSDWLQHKAHDGRPREAGVVRRHLEHNQSSPCGMSFL